MDDHTLDTFAAQHLLCKLSDDRPGQFRQDPMLALINQAYRARTGEDEGMSYLTVPF